jgi:hypothetical protein
MNHHTISTLIQSTGKSTWEFFYARETALTGTCTEPCSTNGLELSLGCSKIIRFDPTSILFCGMQDRGQLVSTGPLLV